MRELIWTYEKCKEVALECKTKSEFRKKYAVAYHKCNKNRWGDVFSHMEGGLKPKGYWTYEKCKELALSCETKMDFIKSKGWGYNTAFTNGWLDDICSHFKRVGNYKKRCIYSYEFKNNIVYVGLTYNFEGRWVKRMNDKNDIIKIYIDKTGEIPIRKKLTEYIDIDKATIMEGNILRKYVDDGWVALNRNKTGSIGGNVIKWRYDVCKEEALKYSTLMEFRSVNNNCLSAIYKNKWDNELLSHLKHKKKPTGYWNKERCYEVSLLCKGRKDFYEKYQSAYASSLLNSWLDDFFIK